jgi:hypothetical protein
LIKNAEVELSGLINDNKAWAAAISVSFGRSGAAKD